MRDPREKITKQTPPCCSLKTALILTSVHSWTSQKVLTVRKGVLKRKKINFQYICVKKQRILNSGKAFQSLLWIRTANTLIMDKCDFSPAVEIANIDIRKNLWND